MRALHLCVALALLLPLSIASPTTHHLLGLSTADHFSYSPDGVTDQESAIPSSVLPAFLRALRQDTSSDASLDLPLSSSDSVRAPTLTVFAHSIPSSLLARVRDALPELAPSGSAFSAASDAPGDSLMRVLGARSVASIDELASVAQSAPSDAVMEIAIRDEQAFQQLAQLVPVLASHAPDGLALFFSVAASEQDDTALKPVSRQEVNQTDTNSTVTEQGPGLGGMEGESEMLAPLIDAPQLAGLIVGFIFFLIFIPGFMCLWKIQTPQTFAILDSNDMKKKLQ